MNRFFATVAAIGLGLSLAAVSLAQDEPQAKAKAGSRYAVPETDNVGKLAEFIAGVRKIRATSREEARELEEQGLPAVQEAARKILKLEKNEKSPEYRLAKKIVLGADGDKVASEGDPGQQKAHLKEMLDYLAGSEKSGDDAQMAMNYAMNLEFGGDRAVAAEAYDKLGTIFEKNREEQIARYGRMMTGAARRMNLVGKPFSLKGTTLDGKPFDLAKLKGKVVLVDFWATWCGPCLAEFPNIEKQYEAFKDKGFEVVGVSIDQDRPALEEFVADKKTPWIVLHDKENEGQHPAVTDYGIFAIPAMMLVGKDGKVISTEARGEELERLLEKHLK